MPDLKIDRLEKSYGSNKILNTITLKIGTGEFISLLGPSGSGKTTILRCIAGLETPDASSGEITLGGETLSGPGKFVSPEKRNLGMVFQNYAVWPHMNVFDNVAFPLRIKRSSDVQQKTATALGLVKLTGLEKRFAHELSGGQQQ
ncbi:MAG: ABC transporter ATP-binding protein, partial [Bdellovibrionia bacterium]